MRDLLAKIAKLREAFAPAFDAKRARWVEHGPAALGRASALGITIDTIGGNCPVQAEGTVEGQPFYFRARGNGWSLDIGPEADWWTDRAWRCEVDYGDGPYGAGWMDRHEAVGFICDAVERWRSERR